MYGVVSECCFHQCSIHHNHSRQDYLSLKLPWGWPKCSTVILFFGCSRIIFSRVGQAIISTFVALSNAIIIQHVPLTKAVLENPESCENYWEFPPASTTSSFQFLFWTFGLRLISIKDWSGTKRRAWKLLKENKGILLVFTKRKKTVEGYRNTLPRTGRQDCPTLYTIKQAIHLIILSVFLVPSWATCED